MRFDNDYVSLDGGPSFKSTEEALRAVIIRYKIPLTLTGSSGVRGWSAWSTLQRCPFLYYLKYVRKGKDLEERPAGPRDVGSLVHAFLAVYYTRKKMAITIDGFIKAIAEEGVDPQAFMTARRVFDAYRSHYDDDRFKALAVEHTAIDSTTENSCRYDTIIKLTNPPTGVSKGLWVLEHKTAHSFTADILDGWALDGEILGQLAFWNPSGCEQKYGKLEGVIINVLGKQKVPQFTRVYIAPIKAHVNRHLKNLKWLAGFRKRCSEHNTWPQFNASCMGRYGKCDGWDYCMNRGL